MRTPIIRNFIPNNQKLHPPPPTHPHTHSRYTGWRTRINVGVCVCARASVCVRARTGAWVEGGGGGGRVYGNLSKADMLQSGQGTLDPAWMLYFLLRKADIFPKLTQVSALDRFHCISLRLIFACMYVYACCINIQRTTLFRTPAGPREKIKIRVVQSIKYHKANPTETSPRDQ